MKKAFIAIVLSIFLVMTAGSVYAYTAHYGLTETTYYDSTKAYDGYTLFTPFAGGICGRTTGTYLIDMEGNVVHTWPLPEGQCVNLHDQLLDNGNLLRSLRGGDRVIQELDWDANVIWQAEIDPILEREPHHDFAKIWNNKLQEYTYILIASKTLPEADAIALGADPSKLGREGRDGYPDGVIEVNSEGKLIWEWHMIDHIIQDFDPTKPNFGVIAEHPEKHDINYGSGLGDGDWQHLNSLDYNQELDHIVTNGRTFSEFYIIDHGASFVSTPADFAADFDAAVAANVAAAAGPAGDFIYRFGNPQVYDAAVDFWTEVDHVYSQGDEQIWYAHDIQWIKEGLPGAGNLLIFDNGSNRGHSRSTYSLILEINPFISSRTKDEEGNFTYTYSTDYVDPPTAGYTLVAAPGGFLGGSRKQSHQVVWSYQPKSPASFYSWYISGMQRMPNGNTVVCSGAHGHFFEITYDSKEVVWEYVNPVSGSGVLKLMPDNSGMFYNSVFRCHRYGPDHPAFAGKDLTPGSTLTGRIPGTLDVYESVPISGWGVPPGTTSAAGAGAAEAEAGEGAGY